MGVRFQEAGKIYYFSPAGFEDIQVGEYVVVETSRGLEICRVIIAPHQVVNAELSETLKPIVRMAFQEDLERMQIFKDRAQADVIQARAIVTRLEMPVTVVSAQYNLDGTRLTVYFNPAGESRVDLRDLLKELQADLGVMVQLRQVGPRDQAKAIGGYGICGRRLCCSSWLTSFPAISIKMAKEQNQPLNPSKISGQCGRLLCCLAYENDMYKQLKAELPRVGTAVSTPSGDARVVGVNALRQVVTLQMEDRQIVEVPASAMAMERGVVRVIAQPRDEEEDDDDRRGGVAVAAPPAPRQAQQGGGDRSRGQRDQPRGRGGPDRGPDRGGQPQGRQQPGRPQPGGPPPGGPPPNEPRSGGPERSRGGPQQRRGNPPIDAQPPATGTASIEQRRPSVIANDPAPAPAASSETSAARKRRRRRRGGRDRGAGGGEGAGEGGGERGSTESPGT